MADASLGVPLRPSKPFVDPSQLMVKFVDIEFKPGRLGLTMSTDGTIESVQDGQARDNGVQVWWELFKIDGAQWTMPLHKEKAGGSHPYVVTFALPFNTTCDHDDSPLVLAAARGDNEAVDQLLDTQADIDQIGSNSQTPLHAASMNGHVQTVRTLVGASANLDKSTSTGATPLYISVYNNHPEVVDELLKARANVNKAGAASSSTLGARLTPLEVAAGRTGNMQIMKQLLNARADINTSGHEGNTVLHCCLGLGVSQEIVKWLLDAKAMVDAPNKNGSTPLSLAAQQGQAEMVEQILSAGADFNQASNEGATPLIIAALLGHTAVVKKLLAAGVDTTLVAAGADAMGHAVQNRHQGVVALLANHRDGL